MAEGVWRDAGGILTLVSLIDEHRGAFEYDWRTRFNLPLTEIPRLMDWAESLRMMRLLGADPSSWVGAELSGWSHPVPREWLVLVDLFDVQLRSKSKRKPKPYPRPWDPRPVKHGGGQAVSIEEWRRRRDRKPN